MAHPADEWLAGDPGPERPRQQARRPGGAPRRSDEKLKGHGCAPEAIKLIRALEELIDARHGSRREFLEDLRHRFRVTISEKTLSNQMGGDTRHRMGPDWDTTQLIVVSCVPSERRILELARIAGLWAHARNEPRPAGYGGAIFPAVTAPDQFEHVQALVAGFPGAPHVKCPGRERVNRLRNHLRFLLVIAVPWLSAILVFHAAITVGMAVLLTEIDTAIIGMSIVLWTLAFLPVSPDRGMHLVEPGQPAWKPASFEMGPGSMLVFDGPFFRHWTPSTTTAPRPARWLWPIRNDLEWTLQAGDAIVAPLGPRRPEWWIDLREALHPELRVCTEGGLMLIDHAGQQPDGGNEPGPVPERFAGGGTAERPDTPEERSEPHPLVEWAILDWEGALYATGLLAPRPVRKVPVAIPGVGAGTIVCGGSDEELSLPAYMIKLGGFVRVPWPGNITILLRRVDTLHRPVRVKWEKAGVHVHAFTVHGRP
jgi:hypothetical protein